ADADFSMNGIGGPCERQQDPSCRQATGAAAQGTCADGEICMLASCRNSAGFPWPDGYCTKSCVTSANCPAGSVCADIGSHSTINLCLAPCTTHADCRTAGQGLACTPTVAGNVCLGGFVCESAPATLPRGDWSPNLRVPAPTVSNFESEGNVVSDGEGH